MKELENRKQQMAQRQLLLQQRFLNMGQTKHNIRMNISSVMKEQEALIRSDIGLESEACKESVRVIQQCVSDDLPALEQSLSEEVATR